MLMLVLHQHLHITHLLMPIRHLHNTHLHDKQNNHLHQRLQVA